MPAGPFKHQQQRQPQHQRSSCIMSPGVSRPATGMANRSARVTPHTKIKGRPRRTVVGHRHPNHHQKQPVQMQLQMQRPPQGVAGQQQQQIHKQPARQSTSPQDHTVSMAEVLEDLRVLEAQQRESQQKLEAARRLKTTRLHDAQLIDTKLESAKYLNGQLRTQLASVRDRLSVWSRDVGNRRLEGSRTGDRIKVFDCKLRGGITIANRIATWRRKMCPRVSKLRHQEWNLKLLHQSMQDAIQAKRRSLERATGAEKSLLHDVRLLSNQSSRYADQLSSRKRSNTQLEIQLNGLQSQNRDGRARIGKLEASLLEAQREHSETMESMNATLTSLDEETNMSSKTIEHTEKESAEIAAAVAENLKRIALIESETQLALLSEGDHDGSNPIPLDLDPLRATLREVEQRYDNAVTDAVSSRGVLSGVAKTIDTSKATTAAHHEEIRKLVEQNKKLRMAEEHRKAEMESWLKEYRSKKVAVSQLEEKVNGLRVAKEGAELRQQNEINECRVKLDAEKKKKDDRLEAIQSQKRGLEESRDQWQTNGLCDLKRTQTDLLQDLRAKQQANSNHQDGIKQLHDRFRVSCEEGKAQHDKSIAKHRASSQAMLSETLEEYPWMRVLVSRIAEKNACSTSPLQLPDVAARFEQLCRKAIDADKAERAKKQLAAKVKEDEEEKEKEKKMKMKNTEKKRSPSAAQDVPSEPISGTTAALDSKKSHPPTSSRRDHSRPPANVQQALQDNSGDRKQTAKQLRVPISCGTYGLCDDSEETDEDDFLDAAIETGGDANCSSGGSTEKVQKKLDDTRTNISLIINPTADCINDHGKQHDRAIDIRPKALFQSSAPCIPDSTRDPDGDVSQDAVVKSIQPLRQHVHWEQALKAETRQENKGKVPTEAGSVGSRFALSTLRRTSTVRSHRLRSHKEGSTNEPAAPIKSGTVTKSPSIIAKNKKTKSDRMVRPTATTKVPKAATSIRSRHHGQTKDLTKPRTRQKRPTSNPTTQPPPEIVDVKAPLIPTAEKKQRVKRRNPMSPPNHVFDFPSTGVDGAAKRLRLSSKATADRKKSTKDVGAGAGASNVAGSADVAATADAAEGIARASRKTRLTDKKMSTAESIETSKSRRRRSSSKAMSPPKRSTTTSKRSKGTASISKSASPSSSSSSKAKSPHEAKQNGAKATGMPSSKGERSKSSTVAFRSRKKASVVKKAGKSKRSLRSAYEFSF